MDDNPYKSPVARQRVLLPASPRVRAVLILACTGSFWIGLALAGLGLFISFYPGAECGYFLCAGILLVLGVFVPKKSYRVVAIAGCILCLLASYAGYQRGIDYHEWLRQRESTSTSGSGS